MVFDVAFDLFPITFIVPDFFAGSTDRKCSSKNSYFLKSFLAVLHGYLACLINAKDFNGQKCRPPDNNYAKNTVKRNLPKFPPTW